MERNTVQVKLNNQTGAVLYISLIMLLLLSLIGIAGMQVTGLEEKMSGNAKDSNLAFQAAETTLRGAEKALSAATPVFDNTSGYYLYTPGVVRWENMDWASASASQLYNISLAGVPSSHQSRYIIEELQAVSNTLENGTSDFTTYYQITAHSVGGANSTVTVLQSVVKQ
jgi:type IV pilus assembly protein PilX